MLHRAAESPPLGPNLTGPLSRSSSLPLPPQAALETWRVGAPRNAKKRGGGGGAGEWPSRRVLRRPIASAGAPSRPRGRVAAQGTPPTPRRPADAPTWAVCVHRGLFGGSTESSRGHQKASCPFPWTLTFTTIWSVRTCLRETGGRIWRRLPSSDPGQ